MKIKTITCHNVYNFGASLLQYAQGSMSWDDLVTKVVADWKTESSN